MTFIIPGLQADTSPAPMTFIIPGLQADTSLEVLGRVFTVHSSILKVHSKFFRTFMDSVDKPAHPDSSSISYDYVTVVDEDNFWGLEAKSKVIQRGEEQVHLYKGDARAQQSSFEKMLAAMYSKRFSVGSGTELISLVTLADFYCSLPVINYSLDSVLSNSPKLISELPDNRSLLSTALKLRHAGLFRECFIHAVGMSEVLGTPLLYEEEVLTALVDRGYLSLCTKLFGVEKALVEGQKRLCRVGRTDNAQMIADLSTARTKTVSAYQGHMASYYRALLTNLPYGSASGILAPIIEPILENHLVLSKTGCSAEVYNNRFLCAEISGGELPWDLEATEW